MGKEITIPAPVVEEIKLYGRENMPLEVCGVFSGRSGMVDRFHPVTNMKISSRRFLFEPSQQYRVFKAVEEAGKEVMGIFHTHPFASARPSDFDVSRASDTPGWFHLIYSPVKDKMNLFCWDAGRTQPLRLQVV